MLQIKALTNFDEFQKGDEFELPPAYAKAVIEKGLAVEATESKAGPAPENKMAQSADNKSAEKASRAAGKTK